MSKLITAERRNKIAELIISNGSIKVGELAKLLLFLQKLYEKI